MINETEALNNLKIELEPFNWQCLPLKKVFHVNRFINNVKINVAIAIFSITNQHKMYKRIDKIKSANKSLNWIAILTDYDHNKPSLNLLFTSYFIDFFHLPINTEKLSNCLGHAHGMVDIYKQSPNQKVINSQYEIVGKSKSIKELKRKIGKVSKVDASVLLTGETGVGKDLCASVIHYQSARTSGPYISINCGALPENLIHSELFGHEKGAFTGATNQYIGHIEQANNGTLLLDEIGDLPLHLQVNLLHFLEEHTIERLGSCKKIPIDCRIIAATHIDLELAIVEGRFREDLFHRLNIINIQLPSLRTHKEDIELLANTFLNKKFKRQFSLGEQALEAMLIYEWPGNVRELQNRLHRAAVLADDLVLNISDLGLDIKKIKYNANRRNNDSKHLNTDILLAAIKRNNHNITAAAKELNISRTTFYRLVKKCNIKL